MRLSLTKSLKQKYELGYIPQFQLAKRKSHRAERNGGYPVRRKNAKNELLGEATPLVLKKEYVSICVNLPKVCTNAQTSTCLEGREAVVQIN